MKLIFLFLLMPLISWAGFGKPELVARFNLWSAWNAPDNTWCFYGEPAISEGRIYLNCLDEKGSLLAVWERGVYVELARADGEQLFSRPEISYGRAVWNEFSEGRAERFYLHKDALQAFTIKTPGPLSAPIDSFLPLNADTWFFRRKGESPVLSVWKDSETSAFFDPKAAFIFTPQIGPFGEIAVKTRENNYDENSPDKLWLWDGASWKVILSDRDADPQSPWLSFRHQLAVEKGKVLLIARDIQGEALILADEKEVKVLARERADLYQFDFFSPKMRAGTIAVRGEDFQKRKATFVYENGFLKKLITQDDIVWTDTGLARVHYQNQDAIFYGAPGIDEKGNVVLQATLTDADYPSTLLGIGLIRFNKE